MKKPKILIIEDEEGIREGIGYFLEKDFELEFAENGVEGVIKAMRNFPNLILLDLNMPEMDGFQTCKTIRADAQMDLVPIIILSAYNSVDDRTKLFELGADDYLTKPVDKNELLARIHRKLQGRFVEKFPAKSSSIFKCGNLILDVVKHQAYFNEKKISLSAIEFKILQLLAEHLGELVNREMIISWAWEGQDISPNLVNPHILSLRNKLAPHNFAIQVSYGRGYTLKDLN